jgi:hypothetical protein
MSEWVAYFDESGEKDYSRIIVMSGFLFKRYRADKAAHEWRTALQDFGIPHFHMVDLAHKIPSLYILKHMPAQLS